MRQYVYGPCGLFCGACGDKECNGCLSPDVDQYVSNCTFRKCTREKDLDFCCFCEDYPCEELKKFMNDQWPHHWTMKPNLAFIKKNGIDAWLESQMKEWSCPACGAEIKWYQGNCACGKKLEAWDVPDD